MILDLPGLEGRIFIKDEGVRRMLEEHSCRRARPLEEVHNKEAESGFIRKAL
jgi:hypothetical protein